MYNEATRNSANYAEHAKDDIAVECVEPISGTPEQCAREIDSASRKEQREEYNLYSQRTVAVWTAIMGGMAVVGVALSAIGIYLIWGTFKETRATAQQAMRQANEAEQSRKTLFEGERAHIKIEEVSVSVKEDTLLWTWKVSNAGNAIAEIDGIVLELSDMILWPDGLEGLAASAQIKVARGSNEEVRDRVMRPKPGGGMIAQGYIRYKTLGEPDRRTHFTYQVKLRPQTEYLRASCTVEPTGMIFQPDDT